jgi:hypothetical protein
MKEFFKELIPLYKKHVKIKQLKKKTIENFSRFYSSFMDQYKDPKDKKDKYLHAKSIGLQYILDNQDLIYSEINK